MPVYVYGLMRVGDARAASAAPQTIQTVEHEGLAAVVRTAADGSVKLRREALIGHADVLQGAFEHGPVLPLRFGSVLPDADAIRRELLAPRAGRLLARLDSLQDRAEMQVKADYLEEPLMRSILERDPGLVQAAKRMRDRPAAATHFERIQVGEVIAAAVEARRAVDAQEMLGALSTLSVAVSASDPRTERSVLNAAFLVGREGLGRFDQAVEQLSEARADSMQLKLIGPMPAYSFADREWERVAGEDRAAAWA
jgi:hypothetical protein